jgi:hypothetical protein
MIEDWKDIAGWEGLYAVSSNGRIKSYDRLVTELNGKTRTHKGRLVTLKKTGRYHGVSLFLHGVGQRYYAHRLVAEAFIPNPDGRPEVNHKDGNKFNNCVLNLEWATRSENAKHAFAMGLMEPPPARKGESQHSAKLTEHDVNQIRKTFKPGMGRLLAQKYGVTPPSIYGVINGRTWQHVA